jgi:hypothetical protein
VLYKELANFNLNLNLRTGKTKMGYYSQIAADRIELDHELSILKYEIEIAKQTIEDLRKLVPDYVEAERLFSYNSISYLRSIGCAIRNMKELPYD